jgi:L-amino acid N-acyltransferase YncA
MLDIAVRATATGDAKPIEIRPAAMGDAEAIALIYNQGIEDRVATLETERRTADERRRWLAARGPRHPVIVAEVEGAVIAWGSLNSFNPRAAYDHVADLSVYVERGWRGRGIGRRILDALIGAGGELGYHKLVLAAFPFNHAGIALYNRLGFREVGVYREQGQLDGKWVDVVVMERLL